MHGESMKMPCMRSNGPRVLTYLVFFKKNKISKNISCEQNNNSIVRFYGEKLYVAIPDLGMPHVVLPNRRIPSQRKDGSLARS